MKSIFEIDISPDSVSPLEAYQSLTRLTNQNSYHTERNFRLPLGIYNVSTSRICDKLTALCQRIEKYFLEFNELESAPQQKNILHKELIDYIELSVYAAAEHIDDIDAIASGFFKNKVLCEKNVAYKDLQKNLKIHKKFISSFANSIKHQQSRIRLYSKEFSNRLILGYFHGYFIEGVESGVICPSGIFHKTQHVFSITALAWEIIFLLLNSSKELNIFLKSVATQLIGPTNTKSDHFQKTIIAAARLPLYTFGEVHPFARTTLKILTEYIDVDPSTKKLYGSILNGWNTSTEHTFGKSAAHFEGDGSSRTFRLAAPKQVDLLHWNN